MMRAPRSPDRTQTTAGAISHRRPDRTYSTPSWCEPDRRPSARQIRRSERSGSQRDGAHNVRLRCTVPPHLPPVLSVASNSWPGWSRLKFQTAQADIVPTDTHLRDNYGSWAELVDACAHEPTHLIGEGVRNRVRHATEADRRGRGDLAGHPPGAGGDVARGTNTTTWSPPTSRCHCRDARDFFLDDQLDERRGVDVRDHRC